MHSLPSYLQWLSTVAISHSLEGLQTNWNNSSILMSILPKRHMMSPNYCNFLLLYSCLPNTYITGNLSLSPTFKQKLFLLPFLFNFHRFFFLSVESSAFLINLISLCSCITTCPYFWLTSFQAIFLKNQIVDEVHSFSGHAGLKWYVDIRHLYDPYISEYGVMEILEPHNSKLNWKMLNSKPNLKI